MRDKQTTQKSVLFFLALLSLGGWLLARQYAGTEGFPLDDAWIHQTYARSLAGGGGWSFTPGVVSAGATAPLWVMLLVPGLWLGMAPFTWVAILGFLQLAALAWLSWRAWPLLGLSDGWWGVAAGSLLVFEWHLVWSAISGMETLLYGLFSLGVITILLDLFSKPKAHGAAWLGAGALVGLGVWLRPEAITLLGPIGMVVLFQAGDFKVRTKNLALAGIGFGIFFTAYLLFNRELAGTWWPNTFYAKQAEYAILRDIPFFERLAGEISPLIAGVLGVLLPGFVGNVYFSIKQRNWVALSGGMWAVGHIFLYAWRLPVTYQHGRYVIPALPLLVLLGLAGCQQIISTVSSARVKWALSRIWYGVGVLCLIFFWVLGLRAYLDDAAVIDGEMVQTARWVDAHTPEGALIAAHDIGALGYFSWRPIVDLAGLVSPDVIPFIRDEHKLSLYLDAACPQYLITFPDWYTELPDEGELVFQTATRITVEMGGTNMAVYRWIGSGVCP